MDKNRYVKNALASLIYAVVLVGAVAGIMTMCVRCGGRSAPVPEEVTRYDTIRIEKIDTIVIEKPAPSQLTQLPEEVKRLPRWWPPFVVDESSGRETFSLDSLHEAMIFDWCSMDSVDVMVPMERKVYTDSVNYRAVISGAWVSLDTMEVYPRHETTIIKQPPNRRKRWGVGLVAAYGWAGRWTFFAGVGVSWRPFEF